MTWDDDLEDLAIADFWDDRVPPTADLGEAEDAGVVAALAEALGDALDPAYDSASLEDLEDAVRGVLSSLSPAESLNFSKALSQIGRAASQVVADPVFGQVASTVLPIAGGAVGTARYPATTTSCVARNLSRKRRKRSASANEVKASRPTRTDTWAHT